MSLAGFLLLLLVAGVIYYIRGSQIEQFNEYITPLKDVNLYARHERELENVLTVLQRPIVPGDHHTENITLLSATGTQYDNGSEDMTNGGIPVWRDPKLSCLPSDHPIYDIIRARQPYMFDDAHVIRKNGEMFYYDWRYPRKPINVKFAADPEGYCRKNPTLYPCNVISSRIDLK